MVQAAEHWFGDDTVTLADAMVAAGWCGLSLANIASGQNR
jgi:hypothetical protein